MVVVVADVDLKPPCWNRWFCRGLLLVAVDFDHSHYSQAPSFAQ
jgi:hypothetical protein